MFAWDDTGGALKRTWASPQEVAIRTNDSTDRSACRRPAVHITATTTKYSQSGSIYEGPFSSKKKFVYRTAALLQIVNQLCLHFGAVIRMLLTRRLKNICNHVVLSFLCTKLCISEGCHLGGWTVHWSVCVLVCMYVSVPKMSVSSAALINYVAQITRITVILENGDVQNIP